MGVAPISELIDERTRLYSWTVDQYHQAIEAGLLTEEPYELLDGYMVRKDRSKAGEDPMTIGLHHAWAVQNLVRLGRKLDALGCYMQVQQPISLPPRDEPEPDGAVIQGELDDYRKRQPGPKDVLCVIEVADSSLNRDRTVKQRIYANAGIPQYVIINLFDAVVEVYTEPMVGKGRYGKSVALAARQSVELPAATGRKLTIPVRRLLP